MSRSRDAGIVALLPDGDPFLPADPRAARRALRRAEAGRRRVGRRDHLAARRAEAEAARRERREALAVPRSGERRPDAGREPWALNVAPHRASSRVMRFAYPFLAGASLGSDLTYVGRDRLSRASFCWDPWSMYQKGVTNPNLSIIGTLGSGKSALSKSLAIRNLAFGRRAYVPGDPKGEWSVVAEAVGGQAIKLGRGLPTRLNPLDAGPRPRDLSEERWATETAARRWNLVAALAELCLERRLSSVERTALDLGLRSCSRASASPSRRAVPTLPQLVEALLRPEEDLASSVVMTASDLAEGSRSLAQELRRLVKGDLAGLFDGPSTCVLDPDAPMVSVDTSTLGRGDDLSALALTCVAAWMEPAIAAGGQRLTLYDEAWEVMSRLPLLRRMRAAWKLSRAYGAANALIVHRLSDLSAVGDSGSEAVALAKGLLADCGTRICYQTEPDQVEGTAAALGLTDTEAELLPTLERGTGLWKVGRRSFLVDC